MNKEQAALFTFGISKLFEKSRVGFQQKQLVWETDNGLMTGKFFNDSPFENGSNNEFLVDLFTENFSLKLGLKNDGFGDRATFFLNNLPKFFKGLNDFIESNPLSLKDTENLSDFVSNIIVKDVTFLDKDISLPSFYLFSEDTSFAPVSIISSETQDKNA